MIKLSDNPPLLSTMMMDAETAPPLYSPGPHWFNQARRSKAALEQHGIDEYRQHATISKGFCEHNNDYDMAELWDPRLLRTWIKRALLSLPVLRSIMAENRRRIGKLSRDKTRYETLYYEAAYSDFVRDVAGRFNLPDTTVGGSPTTMTVDGVKYSTFELSHLMRIMAYAKSVPFDEAQSLMEIGGGAGGTTNLLLHMYPGIRKVIYLDIPPMLYIGTQHLRGFHGDAVVDYLATRDLPKIRFRDDDSREILCIAPWQIERLEGRAIDVFWNSASFREMPATVVQNYAHHVGRLTGMDSHLCIANGRSGSKARTDGHTSSDDILKAFTNFTFCPVGDLETDNFVRLGLTSVFWLYVGKRQGTEKLSHTEPVDSI